jgi:hypothetical protein
MLTSIGPKRLLNALNADEQRALTDLLRKLFVALSND